MTYREKVLTELRKAKSSGCLVSIYKWEELDALLVGRVIMVSDTHMKLDNLTPDGEWEDDVSKIALDEIYQFDVGTPYLNRLTAAADMQGSLSRDIDDTRYAEETQIKRMLEGACESKDVVTVSLPEDGKVDVLVYEVGADYFEFAAVYESGEVESGSNIVPLRFVEWVQIGTRTQELIELTLIRPERG